MFSVLGLHMNVPKINLRFDGFDVEIRVSFLCSNDVSVDGGDDCCSLPGQILVKSWSNLGQIFKTGPSRNRNNPVMAWVGGKGKHPKVTLLSVLTGLMN